MLQESFRRNVHFVREEVITREVHKHDIYHRILPIIDVEILPPRHFLPVEGGGLVEVEANEVPGRASNWVVAETVSKVPAGETGLQKGGNFSARTFERDEGDQRSHLAREGHPVTVQSWVHTPVLESGGRETRQTWPMEFEEIAKDES